MPRPASERPSRQFKATPRFIRRLKSLGLAARALRQSKGLTLEQAAARMDLDFKHLQKIEAGRLNLTFATLVKIAEGLGEVPEGLLVSPKREGSRFEETRTRPRPGAAELQGRGSKSNPSVAVPMRAADPTTGAPEHVVRCVGRRVAELRRERGMTQKQVAAAAGVSVQYMRRVEAGVNLTITSLCRFADLLGVAVEDLFVAPRRA